MDCTCSRDSYKGRVVYTCPACCEKALGMLRRLTSQLEFDILDSIGSVSALDEDEDSVDPESEFDWSEGP